MGQSKKICSRDGGTFTRVCRDLIAPLLYRELLGPAESLSLLVLISLQGHGEPVHLPSPSAPAVLTSSVLFVIHFYLVQRNTATELRG